MKKIMVLVLWVLAVVGCDQQRDTAKQEAMRWASELGYQVQGVSCANIDSDDDGYVSCTVAVVQGDTTRAMPIECRGAFSVGHGCRQPKLNVNGMRGLDQ